MLWSEKRRLCLERDKGICRQANCLREGKQVHHIIPKRHSNDDSLRNLITLCDKHHREADLKFLRYGVTNYVRRWIAENEELEKKFYHIPRPDR